MPQFADMKERPWTVTITVQVIKRVRELADVDLLGVAEKEGALLTRLATDPVLLTDVLYAVLKPQLDAAGVDDVEFGGSLGGDAMEAATVAFLEGLTGFFPNPRDRAIMAAALGKVRAAMELARDRVEAELASGRIEQLVDRRLEELGLPSTASPASSASTPGP